MAVKINLRTKYPIIHQDGNRIFLANGNICLAFKLELPEIYSLAEKDFENLHTIWFQALKSLPNGTVVHKQDVYKKRSYDATPLPSKTFLARATKSYFEGREQLTHESYIFFSWPRNKNFNKISLGNPFIKLPKNIPGELTQAAAEFEQAVMDAIGFLENSGNFHVQPLDSGQVIKITNDYFNGFNEGMDTDVIMEGKDLSIGDKSYGILSINNELCFGDNVNTSKINSRFTSEEFSFHQGFIDDLGLDLRCDHVVNQLIYLDDRNRWLVILNKKREELLKSINFGTQNKIILEKIESILQTISRDDQARIIRGQTSVLCWHQDKSVLSHTLTQIKSNLRELDIIPYQPAGSCLHRYFLSGFFGFATEFPEVDLYVTDLKHALCLWINNTGYRSDSQGVLFNDRLFNIPVKKDVWDEGKRRIKARNFAIFAPTGEGKSFLANNILRQFFEDDTRLVIIDLGGSYSKFAKLYPEQHVILRYEPGKSLGINPFYVQEANDLSPEQVEDLTGFLLELSASGLKVARERKVALKKIIFGFYQEEKQSHSLESFCRYVERFQDGLSQSLGIAMDYFDPVKFLHIMSEYRAGGIYSFLFESQEDQTYRLEDKRMIIFELDEVKDNKEILSVMLKLIKSAIQRTIWKNRSERGIILFDEFAKQLKFENVLESVEFYYQAIRKQNGAIGIILQSINQLPENNTAASILENTQVIYSLHNGKGYSSLQSRLNLSDHDLNQLHSIRNKLTGENRYTEMFIKIGSESNIFRLEVPMEVYAAYLTDGKESDKIMELYNQYNSMEKAITQFINCKS